MLISIINTTKSAYITLLKELEILQVPEVLHYIRISSVIDSDYIDDFMKLLTNHSDRVALKKFVQAMNKYYAIQEEGDGEAA